MKKRWVFWIIFFSVFSALMLTGCVNRLHQPPRDHLDLAKETWIRQINQNPYLWIPKSDRWFFQKPVAAAMPFNPAVPMMMVRVPNLPTLKIEGDFQVQLVGQQEATCIYMTGPKVALNQIIVEYDSSTIYIHRIKDSKMPLKNVVIRIGIKQLENLISMGSSNILGRYINSNRLSIFSSGFGNILLAGNMNLKEVVHYGIGTVTVLGARSLGLKINVLGNGNVNVHGKRVCVDTVFHAGNGCVNILGARGNALCITTAGAGVTTIVGMTHLKELIASQLSRVYLYWVNSDTTFINARDGACIGLAGSTQNLNINLRGAAQFQGQYLRAKNIYVKTAGIAHANVNPASKLFASAADKSSIYYFDSPKFVSRYPSADSVIIPLGCQSCAPTNKPEPVPWNNPAYYTFEPTFR